MPTGWTEGLWPLVLSGVAWIGVIAALFALTRTWSKALAWAFLAAGLVAPGVLVLAPHVGAGIGCAEKIIERGTSEDGRLRYRILRRACQRAQTEFAIEIGRNGDFGVMRTAFRSTGGPTPNSLKQIGPNRFRIYMADPPGEAPDPPLIITVDPSTATPVETYLFAGGVRQVAQAASARSIFGRAF